MQQSNTKHARTNTNSSHTCKTLTFKTSDNQHFPINVSKGRHTATHYLMLLRSDHIINVNLTTTNFQPLQLALSMLDPNNKTPNLIVCAALMSSVHPITRWLKQCCPIAQSLGINNITKHPEHIIGGDLMPSGQHQCACGPKIPGQKKGENHEKKLVGHLVHSLTKANNGR